MTKESPYSESRGCGREICASERKYLFVYPMWKRRDWYLLPGEERMRIMRSHIETGRRHPEIEINTAYSFGIDDQEFVVSFEADDPGRLPRPRAGAAGHGVERATPSATPRSSPASRCRSAKALDALDGAATARSEPAVALA